MHRGIITVCICCVLPACAPPDTPRENERGNRRDGNAAAASRPEKPPAVPLRARDYSFAFWPNGFRREPGNERPHVFAVETGRYGFTLDTADFRNARCGPIAGPGYAAAVGTGAAAVGTLPPADFRIEIEHDGAVYRAVNCLAGRRGDMRETILMESGRFVQHYRFPGLRFEDDTGAVLETNSECRIVAWPASLVVTLIAAPDSAYAGGPCPGIVGAGRAFRGKPVDVPHRPALDPPVFTLELWVRIPRKLWGRNTRHWLIGKNANEHRDSCFGLIFARGTVTAIMNIGGGRKNVFRARRGKAVKPGAWCHLAMTYDGDRLRLYVDGRQAAVTTVGTTRVPGDGALRIGGRPDGHGTPIHAVFDELRIWRRALGAKEIRAHARKPGTYDRTAPAWERHFNDPPGTAAAAPAFRDAAVRIALNDRRIEERVPGTWAFGDRRAFVFRCRPAGGPEPAAPPSLTATGTAGRKYAVRQAPAIGAAVVAIPAFERDWKTGYTDIRRYDEVTLTIDHDGETRRHVPVLFDVTDPANITGQTPVLCDADGRPTGIPVQLSKNWHHGAYAKYYAILPADPGTTRYRLRIAYGFWGALPAASHAQLSLWGYGGNGRWDQLAIGCWGETMCFDVDNSLTPMMITDVRMLMTRNGAGGKQWAWTDGGWGGDWIAVRRDGTHKLMPVAMKTAYRAHGPCLTDARYAGCYGGDRAISFDARVATLRTDDCNRVFQRFTYRVNDTLPAAGSHLFKMGPTGGLLTPRIAWGNRDGLVAEHAVPGDLRRGSTFKKDVVLPGTGPWWVAFPGAFSTRDRDWGTGSRALIVRSFAATFGGKTFGNPTVSFPVHIVDDKRKQAGLDLELVPPPGVTRFLPGDTIEIDVEWITVPRVAEDYYGPNEAFRAHLARHPRSWKTVHREAAGNDLRVDVSGGALLEDYPVIIAAAEPAVRVTIAGGTGAVPVRFEGLDSPAGYRLYRLRDGARVPLDQSVNGNDFWQTDYDPDTGTYRMTFNLPLDGVDESTWLLTRKRPGKT